MARRDKGPVERAIEIAGGTKAVAAAIGISPQAVWKWPRSGVPANRVLALELLTGGEVGRHHLRPDIYPVDSRAT